MNLTSNQLIDIFKNSINKEFELEIEKIPFEIYKGDKFGHFSTSISFEIAKIIKIKPTEVAEKIRNSILNNDKKNSVISKIENINGFLNIYLDLSFLLEKLTLKLNEKNFGKGELYKNKTFVVEYTDTNPFKQFHIGHFMTNAIGESVFRLISSQSAKTYNVCYSGDVGVHVAKCIYGVLDNIESKVYSLNDFLNFSNSKTIEELNNSYVTGSKLFQDNNHTEKIKELNTLIFKISQKFPKSQNIEIVNNYKFDNRYNFDEKIIEKIYDKGLQESKSELKSICEKLGTKFHNFYYESTTSEIGAKCVNESNIFEKSEGAIIWDGKKFGKNVQVLINSKGIPTYGCKDIGLNLLKEQVYQPNVSIILTAREQEFYFKDLTEIFKQLGLKSNTIHVPHGEFRNKNGKMSSRTGDIISLDEVINEIKQEILINFSSKKDEKFLNEISEKIAISCLKYLILKNSTNSNIIYDPKTITEISGNTGAYLLYTYARINSVLKKAGAFTFEYKDQEIQSKELDLLIRCLMYDEAVSKATLELSPVILATYLHDLAKNFNSFYNDCKIISNNEDERDLRLLICSFIKEIFDNGLYLLGIESIENL
jgi:arginyl-tRNA synthetase